jgi:hypothetical protein
MYVAAVAVRAIGIFSIEFRRNSCPERRSRHRSRRRRSHSRSSSRSNSRYRLVKYTDVIESVATVEEDVVRAALRVVRGVARVPEAADQIVGKISL